ncbi:hypothetical protein [Dysosmobacter sp.]|uniref:hypothetical protein n=1 Tax=Dysosmobacter sp. TaxID=2591382 RepID=UPI002F93BDBD
MYIQETTQSERVIISTALDGMFNKVARAHRLLSRVWDDYFGMRDQPDIPGMEAEYLGELIYVIGDPDFPGVEPHLRGSDLAKKAQEVEKLDSMVFDLQKQLKPEPRDALRQKRDEIHKLPDEKAAILLRELLDGKGVHEK